MTGTASSLRSAPRVLIPTGRDGAGWTSTLIADIDPDEPVLAGHYPGFPIFPGVCLVELVRLGALLASPGRQLLELTGIHSTRFLSPTYPGDHLTIDLTWKRNDQGWRCAGWVNTAAGSVANVVLAFAVVAEPLTPAGLPVSNRSDRS